MKQHTWKLVVPFIFLIASSLLITNCEKSVNDSSSANDVGYLTVKITDAPFPIENVSEANVTISKIEVRKVSDGEGNPFITVTEDDYTYNLKTLMNGLTADLPEIEIPVGRYDLVRLYVADASVKLTNGEVFDLTVPSGAQTGIKVFIRPEIVVEGGLSSELLIDFDLSKSFVVQGNPITPAGIVGFIFKPVIRATNLSNAGRIVGMVSDTTDTAVAQAEVWVQQDTVVATTFSEDDGMFAFPGIPSGTYEVYATKAGFDTASVQDVEVVSGNRSDVKLELTPAE